MKKLLLFILVLSSSFTSIGQCSPGPIIGILGACVGSTSTLSDTVHGGIWSSGDTSIATVNSATGLVTALSGGTTTISYTVCGSTRVTATFTVNSSVPSTPGVGGISFLCAGGYSVLTGYPSGGVFSSCDTSIISINPVTGGFTALNGGSAILVYTVNNYCGSSADSDLMYTGFSPAPGTISGIHPVIAGGLDSLVSVGGVSTGTWSISPTSIATISATGVVTGISLGTATVTYYDSAWCFGMHYTTSNLLVGVGVPSFADSFNMLYEDLCGGMSAVANTHLHSPALLRTFYGDGASEATTILNDTGTVSTALSHSYSSSGTYSIKQILSIGGVARDSISYSFNHLYCHDIAITLFADLDSNCHFDTATEILNYTPLNVIVDSNGVGIDTLSVTSGIYYTARGNAGDIYSFRLLSSLAVISCPRSGIIYDTLSGGSTYNTSVKLAGLTFTGTGFDFGAHVTQRVGRHQIQGCAVINNSRNSNSAVVTLHFDPRYTFHSAYPTPTMTSTGVATWNTVPISPGVPPVVINYWLEVPGSTGSWLSPGDTVMTSIIVNPISGDADSTNNIVIRVDTVKSSFDPNYISVTPKGSILNGAKLHYAIQFENDGNDTAQNVYVMDTLSDDLDPTTLNIVNATAVMNISMLHSGGHNIVKFDFPGIKLLDSTHHDQCVGTVIYDIKARTGLADATVIYNHAGIFFDDNPVVLTDSAVNRILVPHISIASATGDTVCHTEIKHFMASAYSITPVHYQWYINTTPVGTDSAGLTNIIGSGDVVKCIMTTVIDDTVISNSNNIAIYERVLSAGTISGSSTVCQGTTIALTDTASGGTWSATNGRATVSTGAVVAGVSAGLDTLIYSVTNVCGTVTASHVITINPFPYAGTITGGNNGCVGSIVALTDSATGGTWNASNTHATASGGMITCVSPGVDTITYTVVNSCGTVRASQAIAINPFPHAGAIIGPATFCNGSVVRFADTCGHHVHWINSDTSIARIVSFDDSGATILGMACGTATIHCIDTNICGADSASTTFIVIPVPGVSSISAPAVLCEGNSSIFTAAGTAGGIWTSSNPSIASASSSGVVTGISGNPYGSSVTITYSITNVCGSASSSATLNIRSIPSVSTISPYSPTVCTGISITDSAIAITGPGGGVHWGLSNGNAVFSGTTSATNATVSGVHAGTVTLYDSASNACGITVRSSVITVSQSASAGHITGPANACVGSIPYFINGGSSDSTTGAWLCNARIGDDHNNFDSAWFRVFNSGMGVVCYAVANSCGRDTTCDTVNLIDPPHVSIIAGATSLCVGSSIAVTDSITGGTWHSSNGHATVSSGGIVAGVSQGIDTISYSLTNYCGTASAIHVVTINRLPNAGTISGTSNACIGSPITLADATTGGTWHSSNGIATVSVSGIVSGVTAGIDTIYYVDTTICGNDTARHPVNVFPVLHTDTIVGASSVCVGSSITLVDSTTGGAWNVSNSHASISSGIVAGISGGTDTVTYRISNYCGAAVASKVVTIENITVPSDSIFVTPDSICAGGTVTFTVIPTNGGSSPFYQWKKFGVNIDTGSTFTYVPTLSDVITCEMSSSAVCPVPASVTSNGITVLVIPVVTPTVSIIASPTDSVAYSGQLITFYATATYGGTYQWYEHGVAISGATSLSYSTHVMSNDTVYCMITSNVPCASSTTATSNTTIIYADYLSVHDFQATNGSFSLFPNPNTGHFTINGDTPDNECVNFEVRDITGKMVHAGKATPENGKICQLVQLDNALSPGSYFVRLVTTNGTVVLFFVKK